MLARLRKALTFLEEAEETFSNAPDRGVPSLARDLLLATIDPTTGKIWNNAQYG